MKSDPLDINHRRVVGSWLARPDAPTIRSWSAGRSKSKQDSSKWGKSGEGAGLEGDTDLDWSELVVPLVVDLRLDGRARLDGVLVEGSDRV